GRIDGNVQFFGLDMQTHQKEIKNRIGVVLDGGCFYDELTLAEMKSVLAPAYTSWCEADFKHYMERFSLNPKQQIQTLSKGMKMKYALALALSHKAELLIMDEPTSGLDPVIRSQLLSILSDYMNAGGKGVLFSTHITSDLDKIADTVIMMKQGHIIFQEEKDSLLEHYRIVKGDTKNLTPETQKLFKNITSTAFGFTGITTRIDEVKMHIPDIIMERPTIEDIMLANMEGEKK
ncbi:MAG: ABC transporter ATP-binding protein, partial [Lachnospiraceae bacterium]|nr:ABC transporter ATP-binding protein [Lachnospiraceae bacterium]